MSSSDHNLEGAYALQTPEDSIRLYKGWANTYDEEFAAAHGYCLPEQVARSFAEQAGAANAPVLDIGAGTGLVAKHLSGEIDGIDISSEMLGVAGRKGLYRRRIVADLTASLPIEDASYGGFISAGTFTHGHVGPACLSELMRIARPGALFCLAINARAFDMAGFGSAFAELVADRAITPVAFDRVPIYRDAEHEHSRDTSLIARFHRV